MSDDKYWSDYSFFIKRTEELTNYAPSSLLELYEDFVHELEEGVGGSFEESINDDAFPLDFIRLSYIVIDDDKLSTNILKEQFRQNISKIENRFQSFLLSDIKSTDWRKTFKVEYVDWNKVKFKD